MSLNHLPAGSFVNQLAEQKREFRKFLEHFNRSVIATNNRFADVQGAFATALLNHETRIKELEAKLAIIPAQEMQDELENQIVESTGAIQSMDGVTDTSGNTVEVECVEEEKPTESKVRFHKEY